MCVCVCETRELMAAGGGYSVCLREFVYVCVCETWELMAAGGGYLWLSSRSTASV